ncbi:MAG: Holliday junction resolvase RuvX [Verrucomicrobiota bacterium]
MSRILAIDHGDARVGLAMSDDLGMLAHPLETIHVAQVEPIERIAKVVTENRIETVVLGMPFRMDGSEGTAVEKVREFAQQLQKNLGDGVQIVEVDERMTTVTAQEKLRAAGRKVKQTRGIIDQAAAVVILQEYMDAQQGLPLLPPDPDDENEEIWG